MLELILITTIKAPRSWIIRERSVWTITGCLCGPDLISDWLSSSSRFLHSLTLWALAPRSLITETPKQLHPNRNTHAVYSVTLRWVSSANTHTDDHLSGYQCLCSAHWNASISLWWRRSQARRHRVRRLQTLRICDGRSQTWRSNMYWPSHTQLMTSNRPQSKSKSQYITAPSADLHCHAHIMSNANIINKCHFSRWLPLYKLTYKWTVFVWCLMFLKEVCSAHQRAFYKIK